MSILQIVQIDGSEMDNFSYLVVCPETLQGAAIDPSMRPERLIEMAEQLGITLKLLLNTHNHHDHIVGNRTILEQPGVKLAGHPLDFPDADIAAREGTTLELGNGVIKVIHTPGHTPGSVTFTTAEVIMTGDTLFVGRCGRADFPGSDPAALYASLQRLKNLPPETQIFPGHDYGPKKTSTIGWERENNDYLKCPNLDSFIELRMG